MFIFSTSCLNKMSRSRSFQTFWPSSSVQLVETIEYVSTAICTTKAPSLWPIGILQMAIKMHEAHLRRTYLLRGKNKKLREEEKQVASVAKLTLQGPRELQMCAGPPWLSMCTSENQGCASCYLPYQLKMRRVVVPRSLPFGCQEWCSEDGWRTFQRSENDERCDKL